MSSTEREFKPKESPSIENAQLNASVAESESSSDKNTILDAPSTTSVKAEEDEGEKHAENADSDSDKEVNSAQVKQEDSDDAPHTKDSDQLVSAEPVPTDETLEPTQADTLLDAVQTPEEDAGRDREIETQADDVEIPDNNSANSEASSVPETIATEESPQTLNINTNSTSTDARNNTTTEENSVENEIPRTRQKRKITVLEDLEIVDPKSYRVEKIRKKVPGRLVDTFWEPLDPTTLSSFYKILHLSLSKTMERYKSQPKIVEARRVLANTWINDNLKSFNSRLGLTKVPPLSTMTTKLNEVNDILNFDVVLSRKKYLETCLLAELKQLHELEKHEQNLQLSYNLDLEYLQQLKKTASKQEQNMIRKINEKREALALDEVEQADDGINLNDARNPFNPHDDEEVVSLLTKLNQHLTNVENSSKKLGQLNDRLEVVNNILDML